MLPFLFVALGGAFFVTGLWEVGVPCIIAAALQWWADENSRQAEAACKAAGIDRTASNIAFGAADLAIGGVLLFAIWFVLSGG